MASEKDLNDAKLRVLENEPSEEVIRLDKPDDSVKPLGSVNKPKKLTKMGVQPRLVARESPPEPQPVDDSAELPPEKIAPETACDTEDAWAENSAQQGVKKTPMGWFFLVGIIILGTLGWAVSQLAKTEKTQSAAETEEKNATMTQLAEREDAQEYYQRLEDVVSNYLKSESIEEKLKFVRQSDRVAPLMRDYYSDFPLESQKYQSINAFMSVAIENNSFLVLGVVTESGRVDLLVEDRPEGFLVDWESNVVYQPMEISDFVEKKPTKPVDLRVYIQRDKYHSREFSDSEKFSAYYVTFKDSDEYLFGYAERDSDLDISLRELCKLGNGSQTPALLALNFLPDSPKEGRSVLISALQSPRWAYVEDPSKSEAGKK